MFFDTPRATWALAGVAALNLILAVAAATGVVGLPIFSSDAPEKPAEAASAVPVNVAAAPPTTTTSAQRPTTTGQGATTTAVTRPAPSSATVTTVPSATTSTTSSMSSPPLVAPTHAAPPQAIPTEAPADVARRQPSAIEVQRAIDGFRPYVRSLFPVSPSPEQVAELGDKVCTAFDEGQTVAQVKATGREMAEKVPFASLRAGGEDYILRTGVALYCPGHTPNLA